MPGKLITVKIPDLGAEDKESTTECMLKEWKAEVGEFVEKGSIVATLKVAGDGAVAVEVPAKAEADGILEERCMEVNEKANVGASLCTIIPGNVITVQTPSCLDDSSTEGNLTKWRNQVGDFVIKGSTIATFGPDTESVPPSQSASAPADCILKEIFVKEGDKANVGEKLCTVIGVLGEASSDQVELGDDGKGKDLRQGKSSETVAETEKRRNWLGSKVDGVRGTVAKIDFRHGGFQLKNRKTMADKPMGPMPSEAVRKQATLVTSFKEGDRVRHIRTRRKGDVKEVLQDSEELLVRYEGDADPRRRPVEDFVKI